MMSATTSPLAKRVKLESDDGYEGIGDKDVLSDDPDDELDGEHCSICLQLYIDRAVIPECSHEFCFDCILTWTDQSRRCPLCTRTIGPYLIHHIRSNFDYQKYHLPPLRSSPPPIRPLRAATRYSASRRSAQERRWGRRERRLRDVADELEQAIDKRRWVYHNHLYAKHVASNTFTRYRPFPTPAQFAASQDYISRATAFIRRELRVWVNLDVEFLTTFIISLMKALDIRSESTVKLLAEFLDMDTPYVDGNRFRNAEHFAHELYSYIRSPYKSLSAYDANVQYDTPKDNHRPISTAVEQSEQLWNDRHRSEEIRYISPSRNGSGPSGSKLNDYATRSPSDDDIHSDSSHPWMTPSNKKGNEGPIQKPDTTPDESNEMLGVLPVTLPSHVNEYSPHRVSHAQSSSQRDRKGKQRATADDVATSVTPNHGHASIADSVFSTESSEVLQVRRTINEKKYEYDNSGTTTAENVDVYSPSVDAENHSSRDNMPGYHSLESSADQLEKLDRPQTRRRNPFLIARAHLNKASADAGSETMAKLRTDITDDNGAAYSDRRIDLTETPLNTDKRPSLLSRITDPLNAGNVLNPALTAMSVSDPVRNSDVHPKHVKITSPLDQTTDRDRVIQDSSRRTAGSTSSEIDVTDRSGSSLRLRLLHRLEAERAKQLNVQSLSGSGGIDSIEARKGDSGADLSTDSHSNTSHFASGPIGRISSFNGKAATSPNEAHKIVETEAKLRARARLRMKLAVEKYAQSPRSAEVVSSKEGEKDSLHEDSSGCNDFKGPGDGS